MGRISTLHHPTRPSLGREYGLSASLDVTYSSVFPIAGMSADGACREDAAADHSFDWSTGPRPALPGKAGGNEVAHQLGGVEVQHFATGGFHQFDEGLGAAGAVTLEAIPVGEQHL